MADDPSKEREQREEAFGFGGAGSAGKVFDRLHDPGRHVVNQRLAAQNPAWVKQDAEDRQTARMEQMARSAATGDWVRSANEHAAKLYDEDGMDYNTMRRYAQKAGIKDINSENDVQGIRDAYNAEHTSQSELDAAFAAYGKQDNEVAAEPEKAAQGMTYNQYLEASAAGQTKKATEGIQPDGDSAAGAAQELVRETANKIKGDKGLVAKGKAKQGQYSLTNLGSKEFQSDQEGF